MKTPFVARIIGIALFVGLLGGGAWAQEPDQAVPGNGSVRGQVIDSESAAPLEGVKVTIVSAAGEEERTTDAEGAFEFPAVLAGSYSVKFVKQGYRASTMTSFAVKAGEANRADFPLPPLPP